MKLKKRNLQTFDFHTKTVRAVNRLKKRTGWTKLRIVETAILEFEATSGL